ncbi:sodium:solute symporter [Clostridium sediminicola]|uniref:sodium:solute symporter family transporter n=1 Tax=Clostridium sediminicola TaxID=3114879 RepID=UPI0031F25718
MISTIDSIVIVAYLLGMILIGYFAGKDNETQEDYLLAGRSMPWLPIALSVAATMISANSFVGAPGWAYNSGIAPYMVNITVPLAIFIALYITTPVIYHLKITSIYEYMELRLGGISRNLTVAQFFINSLIQVSSMVFVPALILQTITGWSLNVIVPIIVLISIVYTLLGGIKAVIWTDAVQTAVVWLGVILAVIIPLKKMNMGFFETIGTAQAAGKLQALDFSFSLTNTNAFWVALIGGAIMWTRYFCFDQAQIQRVLTAKSMKGVKSSLASSSVVMSFTYFATLLVGLILWVFYGGKSFDSSNQIMIGFILEELPVGIVGLVIAGAFAAAMSSVDSLLNSMTTVFIKDIYEKYFYKGKGEVSLKLTMTISAVFGIVIIFVVILAFGGTVKSVLELVGKYISYFSGPACGAFLLAMFTTKANDKGVATGFILSFLGGYWIAQTYHPSWLWNPAIGATLSVSIGFIASLIFKGNKADEEVKKYTAMGVRKEMIAQGLKEDDGVSILPFTMDKYAIFTLVFFVVQYIFLAIIQ